VDTQTLILVVSPLIVIQIALQIYALVDVWRHKGARGSTILWVVVILLFQIFGAGAYFLLGRKESTE
jgi:heme/copper-type cytochrome/quinol oxidase subunit 4